MSKYSAGESINLCKACASMGWQPRWAMGHASHGSLVKSSMGHLGHGSLWVTHSLLWCGVQITFILFVWLWVFVT